MQKSPLLKVILFFCLIFIGSIKGPVLNVFAAGPGCILMGGSTNNLAPNILDFNSILFNTNLNFAYKGCIKPIGLGEYISDGWAWNDNLGWLSLAARVNPQNPSQKINSGVVVNSNFEYGITINKTMVSGQPKAKLLGYIWGDNAGWIKMNCTRDTSVNYDSDHCNQQKYGVEVDFSRPVKNLDDYYYLKGYAWNPHYGYIDFSNVVIAVPDVNYDFVPVVSYEDGEEPNYANGSNTDQELIVRLFSQSDPNRNVSQFFHASPFKFCLIFDDQRTLNGVDRFTSEFNLASNDCTNHADDFLNILDSNAGFEFDMEKNAYVLGSAPLRSFLSTQEGDLNLAYVKFYSDDPAIGVQHFPVDDIKLSFDPPYEVYLSKGEFNTFDQVEDNFSDGFTFDYNADGDDAFTLGVKLYRGELPNNTFTYHINLGSSDNDLLNLSASMQLEDVDGDLEIVNPDVDTSFTPAFSIDSSYDNGTNTFTVPLNLDITKFQGFVPDSIIATSIDVDVEYPFITDNGAQHESKMMASMVRADNFETFESFMKGYIQDRAFNTLYDDKEASKDTNYAKFKSLINRELSQGDFKECFLSDLNTDACLFTEQNMIVVTRREGDEKFIKLSDLRDRVFSLNELSNKTVLLKGFDIFVDENFGAENGFGVVALIDSSGQGGRMYVDYGVTEIINLFVYLDRNLMSVDGIEDVNLAVNDRLQEVGVGSVTESKSFNQLVFNGQLISNNCSGCSRGQTLASVDGNQDAQLAKFADGRLVANEDDLTLAKQDDLNLLRYSPLVLNVERNERFLRLLGCEDQDLGILQQGMFNNGLSLDKLCFMPERLGFDIKVSDLAVEFPKNKQRSFMLFYADPGGLPIFSRVKR